MNATSKAKKLMTQPQRQAALRVARCYRTMADMTSLILARMPPVYLLARERKWIADIKRAGGVISRHVERMETVRQW